MDAAGSLNSQVVSLSVELPDKAARARAATYGGRKPVARVGLMLDDGRELWESVPVRVARVLNEGALPLPCSLDAARASLAELSQRVCFALTTEMLSRRDHATDELKRKLRAYGFTDAAIDAALAQAKSKRFIDDRRFASYFIEERIRRGWGRKKIEAELAHRGITPSELPGYPEAYFTAEGDAERARQLLAKRVVPSDRAYEKLVRFLVSRGFDFGTAQQAVRDRLCEYDDM